MKEVRQQPGVVSEVLRHARHEWLNQLQLVKGYLELGNEEKVREILNDIVFQANQETKLSNLKMDKTAELLLTYNWGIHNYTMEFEVLAEGQTFLSVDDIIYKWIEVFLHVVDTSSDMFSDNFLSITINGNEEECCFIFDFSGKLKEIDEMKRYVGQQNVGIDVHMHECSLDVFSIEMRVKR